MISTLYLEWPPHNYSENELVQMHWTQTLIQINTREWSLDSRLMTVTARLMTKKLYIRLKMKISQEGSYDKISKNSNDNLTTKMSRWRTSWQRLLNKDLMLKNNEPERLPKETLITRTILEIWLRLQDENPRVKNTSWRSSPDEDLKKPSWREPSWRGSPETVLISRASWRGSPDEGLAPWIPCRPLTWRPTVSTHVLQSPGLGPGPSPYTRHLAWGRILLGRAHRVLQEVSTNHFTVSFASISIFYIFSQFRSTSVFVHDHWDTWKDS